LSLVKKCRHPRADWNQCHCSWYADLRIAGQRVYRNLGPDKQRARRAHDALLDDRDAGVVSPDAGVPGLDAVAKRWLRQQQGREKTLVNYHIIVGQLTEWFGAEPVQRITQGSILDFEAELRGRGYATGTVRNIRRALLAVLRFAHAEGLREPPPKLPFIKDTAAGRVLHLTPEEAAKVLGFAQPAHRFLYFTGLRAGELLGLHWSDLDPAAATARIQRQLTQGGVEAPPKSKAAVRIVDLPQLALEALPERTDRRVWDLGYHTLLRQWHAALDEVKRPHCGLHVLRHSNVALRLAADPPQDLMYIAEQLGHSSAGFTLRVYGHLIRRPGRAAGLDAAYRDLSRAAAPGTVPQ
jgi:integrase